MAARSVANRSETLTITTPRGQIEVARQQWRSLHARSKWRWEWLARRAGQQDWRSGTTAREAIRQAALLPPGKQPAWLREAAERDQRARGVMPGAAMPSPELVSQVFQSEFDMAYDEGGLFVLTMHPHVTGHRSRIAGLDKLIQHMKSRPGVWFATHEQVARYVKENGGR